MLVRQNLIRRTANDMNAFSRNIHKISLMFLLFVFGGGVADSFGQNVGEGDSTIVFGEPYQPIVKTPDSLVMLTKDQLFYRPDVNWGFRINLSGFIDLSKVGMTRSRVGFGVREDSVGMTLSQMFITRVSRRDEGTSKSYFADRHYSEIVDDTSVITSTVRRDTIGIFLIIEYDKNEVWPQKDRENPGMSFDSSLVRRHFSAITTYGACWIHVHLSKTDSRGRDSTLFVDILNTFELIDPLPIAPRDR